MTPDRMTRDLVLDAPLLHRGDTVARGLEALLDCHLPALPVVDESEKLIGIFGEREFIGALFPGYLSELTYAGFVPSTLDDTIDKRATCRDEPVGNYTNTEHVDVGPDFSDTQIAETFLHHRVLLIPVVEAGHVHGVITRADFVRRLAERFLERQ